MRYRSDLGKLFKRFDKMRSLPQRGQDWAEQSAKAFEQQYRQNLEEQGRGGAPPPLSSATRKIYAKSGEPDGSGIRDHIERRTITTPGGVRCIVGIPRGRPTIVARVQNHGATIRVTERMRGFLAAHGIHLRATKTTIRIPGRRSWDNAVWRSRKQAIARRPKL